MNLEFEAIREKCRERLVARWLAELRGYRRDDTVDRSGNCQTIARVGFRGFLVKSRQISFEFCNLYFRVRARLT